MASHHISTCKVYVELEMISSKELYHQFTKIIPPLVKQW